MTQEAVHNIQHIANQVATEHDRKPSDLKRKRYKYSSNIQDMKQEFVKRCCEQGIQLQPIADYMEHSLTTVSEIFKKSGGERTYKTDKLLQKLENNDTITVKENKDYQLIDQLRKRGHCIVNVAKYQYKLL